ncbi:hypothetical protein H9W95_01040 [Flavobacterium lindanitolerans]|nr:hypothetical protein [Flavobacterium lindanitolerans]
MFYFYLKNIHNRNTFFHFLPRAKWYLNDHLLQTVQGYNNDENYSNNYGELIQEEFYHIERTQEHANDYFRKNFITIKDIINIDNNYSLPSELSSFIPAEELKVLADEKLIWIRIEFPNVIGKDILSEIFCANNCFPVINKKLNEVQGNIKNLLNIYPLNLNNEFFFLSFSRLLMTRTTSLTLSKTMMKRATTTMPTCVLEALPVLTKEMRRKK